MPLVGLLLHIIHNHGFFSMRGADPLLGINILVFLSEFNQNWAKNAGALVFLLSNSLMIPPGSPSPVPSRTHSFDTGAAWLAFALQGTKLGWYTHGMAGFDMDRAVLELKVPTTHNVEIAIAVGKIGDKLHLPGFLQSLETPNERKALTDISFEGHFPESLIKQN